MRPEPVDAGPRAPALVDFFIDRPIFAGVIAILITLAGLISAPRLPISQFPPIAPPSVSVSANYSGASADVVERTVTLPIEEQVNGTEGMLYMSSASANDGQMSLTVTFELGTNADIATVNVTNRVAVAEPRLPEEVQRYGITARKQAPDLTMVVNLFSPDGSRDTLYLSNYALINVVDALKRVPGVGEISLPGERRYAMRIWLDPQKLAKLGLTSGDIVEAVREQNKQVAAGRTGASPAPAGQQVELPLRTKGRLESVAEFEAIVIRAEPDGSLLRLRDVARVELGAQNYNGFTRLTGQPAMALGVFQVPDANALDVSRNVRAELARLAERFPSGVDWRVRYDPTQFVSESIGEVVQTLLTAIVLVFLVVYVFLQDWRTTLIPAITIPVSLIGTLAVLNAIGLSINSITLFALVLAIGLVVDDAIVVVENVARLIGRGMPRREAVRRSMGEVTSAIVASTLVLGAVFVPVAFLPGTTGLLLRQFGLAVTSAVLISLLNALTLSPALCALLMRAEGAHRGRFFDGFDRGFGHVMRRYDGAVRWLLPRRSVVLGSFAVLGLVTALLFRLVPSGFLPDEDQGYFMITFQLPDGAALERTEQVATLVEAVLHDTPGIVGWNLFGAYDVLTNTSPSNVGSFFVTLAPWSERGGSEESLQAIMAKVQPRVATIPEAVVRVLSPAPVRGLSRTGGFEFQLEDRAGGSVESLAAMAQKLIEKSRERPELANLFTSFRSATPQIFVDLDRAKAKALGVRVDDVFETLQTFMGGLYVNDFDRFGRPYRVYAQAESDLRASPEDVERLWVRSERGEMVPVSTLVKLSRIAGPRDIPHYNVYRAATIRGQAAPGYSSGEALDAMEELAREILPNTMAFEWTGTAYQERQVGRESQIVLALSLLVVFLFLAAQFESWSLPFVILLAVPLAFLGALGAQLLRGLGNDLFGQIGLVTLIGLASKNSILIVEFAKRRHAEGASLVDAAREAAETRFRPVVMTALAFVLGVVPLLISTGAGSAARRSLGTAVFGGMLVATALTLALVPALYVIVQSAADRIRRRLRPGERDGMEGVGG
ncbi:MAG: multidrug efflux RND transporter permease subunit [Deltaproteobacteria bacterium]|nr:multidrug efflux RND transporter permease subunit [Deltaproteobacteria bacterium]